LATYGAGGGKDSTSVQSVLVVVGASSSPHRAEVYDFTISSSATPADVAFLWIVQRCTTSGTGATLTPNCTEPSGTSASTTVVKDTITADPTLTASAFLAKIALNQKSTFRWAQTSGHGLIIGSAANNGLIIGASSATTTVLNASCYFEEF